MEGLTRLVADSLARHGFDRPVDFRRLQWSRWFHCDSQHSLLYVPSKPGVFALAEEVMDFACTGGDAIGDAHVGTTMHVGTPEQGATTAQVGTAQGVTTAHTRTAVQGTTAHVRTTVEERRFSAASSAGNDAASAAGSPEAARRMLAVTQFFESDDMAFTLDRMLSRPNPMRARLASGRYFIRFVVIEDALQRRTVASALNQWIVSAAEKASGLGAHFASSLELTSNTEPAHVGTAASAVQRSDASVVSTAAGSATPLAVTPQFDHGAATNIHRPHVFPSGF